MSELKVVKRTGRVVNFDSKKIKDAITKAYLSTEGLSIEESNKMRNELSDYVNQISQSFSNTAVKEPIRIEDIQDRVELLLFLAKDRQQQPKQIRSLK